MELRDASFFESHPSVTFAAELPSVGDDVGVYGYPMGGEALSITKGVAVGSKSAHRLRLNQRGLE